MKYLMALPCGALIVAAVLAFLNYASVITVGVM